MPKLKPSEDELKNRAIRGYISKNMALYALGEDQVALKVGFTKRTFQNKRKRPKTFTLKELRKICVLLKFTPDEKEQIL